MFFVCYRRFTYMKRFFYINFFCLLLRLYLLWVYAFLYRLVRMDSRWGSEEDLPDAFILASLLACGWFVVGFIVGWDAVWAFDMSTAQVAATLASTFVCPTKVNFSCGLFRLEDYESQVLLWFFS